MIINVCILSETGCQSLLQQGVRQSCPMNCKGQIFKYERK